MVKKPELEKPGFFLIYPAQWFFWGILLGLFGFFKLQYFYPKLRSTDEPKNDIFIF